MEYGNDALVTLFGLDTVDDSVHNANPERVESISTGRRPVIGMNPFNNTLKGLNPRPCIRGARLV